MTDPDVREVYEFVVGRLDMDYVRDTAKWVAGSLRGQGLPIGVALQPGDGTRYDLVFLPIQNISHAPGRLVNHEMWPHEIEFGISREPGTAIVAYQQQNRVAGLDLRSGGFEPVYLGELYGVTLGSACTLAILFNAIGENWNA